MKSLFPHLAEELIKGLTTQSSTESKPTTIYGGKSSFSPEDNSQFTGICPAKLHEHDLQKTVSTMVLKIGLGRPVQLGIKH